MNPEFADKIVYATRYVRPAVATMFGTLALFVLLIAVVLATKDTESVARSLQRNFDFIRHLFSKMIVF